MQQFAETRQLVFASLMVALGIALNVAEGMLPLTLPFPGAKIGLANIALLLCLCILPLRLTVSVFFLRVLLASILLGTFLSTSFFIGGAGGFLSLVVMLTVKKIPCVSLLGVSIAGAAAHNLGQMFMAAFIINNYSLLYYLPIILVLAIPAGFLTGLVARAGVFLVESRQIKKPA